MPPLAPPLSGQRLQTLIQVAQGRAQPDWVIRGPRIFNVFTGDFSVGELAIWEDRIAGVAPVGSFQGSRVLETEGFLVPGFIDSHLHIESSMASPQALAPLLLENGVTAAVADPHEIVNVAGTRGLDYFLAAADLASLDYFLTLPSCVPATSLERGGAEVQAADLRPYFGHPRVVGLGEMMNYPGVLTGAAEVLAKLSLALSQGSLIDGHAPQVSGLQLGAYRAAGISSDHEAATAQEGRERLEMGFWLMIREGTAARNLKSLWPAVTQKNARFCLLATDDRHARDLVQEGSVNHLVRLAQSLTPDWLPEILSMATLNAAQRLGLSDRGALAPGYLADLALYEDLASWVPRKVWKNGRLVVDGEYLAPRTPSPAPPGEAELSSGLRLAPLSLESLKVPATGSRVRVIGLTPGQLVTESLTLAWPAQAGFFEANPELGVVKMATWNRYGGDGRAQVGFLKGLGLRRGALAQSVSHDSHHLVAAGVADEDILLAAQAVIDLGGGLALALEGQVISSLALPLGGLMSHAPVREIARALAEMAIQGGRLGLPPDLDPFLSLGFMSLPVIPKLKLTVAGLIEDFQVVGLVLP